MKRKLFISFIITIIWISVVEGLLIFRFSDDISLIKDEIIIEYGNTYNPNLKELINLSENSFINLDKIRIENKIENEKDKTYPAVGEYEINVYYKKKNLKQKVKVVDTISPELSIKDVEIPANTDLATYNFRELINVSDLSEVKDYEMNLNNVNSSVGGEYVAKVSVEDIYSNRVEKEFKITIKEKEKEKIVDNSNNKENKIGTNAAKTNTNKYTKDNTNKSKSNSNITNNTNTPKNSEDNNKPKNTTVETPQQKTTPTRCTNNSNHGMDVGNSDKWYATKAEAISDYENKRAYWGELWESFKIEKDEYLKNCPYRL